MTRQEQRLQSIAVDMALADLEADLRAIVAKVRADAAKRRRITIKGLLKMIGLVVLVVLAAFAAGILFRPTLGDFDT